MKLSLRALYEEPKECRCRQQSTTADDDDDDDQNSNNMGSTNRQQPHDTGFLPLPLHHSSPPEVSSPWLGAVGSALLLTNIRCNSTALLEMRWA